MLRSDASERRVRFESSGYRVRSKGLHNEGARLVLDLAHLKQSSLLVTVDSNLFRHGSCKAGEYHTYRTYGNAVHQR